jgi:hypothetical protein
MSRVYKSIHRQTLPPPFPGGVLHTSPRKEEEKGEKNFFFFFSGFVKRERERPTRVVQV